jgi:DNA-binding PadR family transcriptional regulator
MPDKSAGSLGELEALVLLAVLRCAPEAYGVAVRDEIRRRAGRALTLGTVYKTLIRLEAKRLLATSVSAPEPRRGGRRRKLYRLTAHGRRALQHTLAVLDRMTRGLPAPLGVR